MVIDGSVLLGFANERASSGFSAHSALDGSALAPLFAESNATHVERACTLAAAAFHVFRETSLGDRAAFLDGIAEAIIDLGDALIERAMAETGLPQARLVGERGRTVGQLRLFADLVCKGEWIDATIDPALPDRTPLRRADLRMRKLGIGPVAVFGASNFPLAFSVAGGDTASALAAGCPVVVKGHPAHPGTGELVGRAIQAAAAATGMPEGVFSLLPGTTPALSIALVQHPKINAVGFTGSRSVGLALMAGAAARAVPIPVFAEMSSINPVILLPGALSTRAEALGVQFVASLTMGAGQFCTNPGLVLAIDGPDLARFVSAATAALAETIPQVMLSASIIANYVKGVERLANNAAVSRLAGGSGQSAYGQARGVLFATDARSFLRDPALADEVFGATSLVVRCRDADELSAAIESLDGQLTATLQLEDVDLPAAARLLPLLEDKVGRILVNGWPTGVEVSHAMVHGGPFPATSDVRTTSVGSLAIERFLRPICYQDVPDALLPHALRCDNPWHLPRRMDGQLSVKS